MASNVPSTTTSQLSDKRINENENVLARKKRKHSRKTIDILLTIHLADRFYQKPASWIFGVVKTWKNERGGKGPVCQSLFICSLVYVLHPPMERFLFLMSYNGGDTEIACAVSTLVTTLVDYRKSLL